MARRSQTWLADALIVQRDLAPDAEALAALVTLLGLPIASRGTPAPPPKIETIADEDVEPSAPAPEIEEPSPDRPAVEDEASALPLPKIISTLTRVSSAPDGPVRPVWFESTPSLEPGPTPLRRDGRPLFSRLQRRSILSYALSTDVAEGTLDIARITSQVARRQPLRTLPRLRRRTLRFGAEVLLDRSPWMAPWFREQTALVDYVRTLLPDGRLTVTRFSGTPRSAALGAPADGTGRNGSHARRGAPPADPRRAIVVLSDIGIGYHVAPQSPPSIEGWIAFGRAAARAGRRFVTFAPYHRSRWPAALGRHVPMLHWSERTTATDAARLGHGASRSQPATGPASDAQAVEDPVQTLARLLSVAVRIDPWLLRECRLTVAPQLDVGVEADLWFSDIVASRGPSGFVLDPSIANALRDELRQQDDLVVHQAATLVARAHEGYPTSVLIEEQLNALSVRRAVTDAAVETLLQPALKSIAGTDRAAFDVARWASHAWGRLSADVQATPSARRLAFAAALRLHSDRWLRTADAEVPEMPDDMAWLLPPDVDDMVVGLEVRRWPDGQVGLHIVEPSMETNAHHHLRAPHTQPAWIEIGVEAGDENELGERVLLAVDIGASVPLPGRVSHEARWPVRTIRGDRFELSLPGEPAAYRAALVWIWPVSVQPGSGRTGILTSSGLALTDANGLDDDQTVVVSQSRDQEQRGIVRLSVDKLWAAVWLPRGRRSRERLERLISLDIHAQPFAARPARAGSDVPRLVQFSYPFAVTEVELDRRSTLVADGAETYEVRGLESQVAGLLVHRIGSPRFEVATVPPGGPRGFLRPRLEGTPVDAAVELARRLRRDKQCCYVAYQRGGAEAAHAIHKALTFRLGSQRVRFDRGSQFPDEPHPSTLPTGVTALDAYLWVGPPPSTAGSRRELEHIRALHIPLLWIPLEEKPDDALKKVPPGLEDLFNDCCWLAPPGLKLPLDAAGADRLAEAIARWDPWETEAPTIAEAPLQQVRPPTLAKRVGTSIREQLIGRLDNREHATELYRTPLLQPFARRAFVVPRGPEPILLLVHARMSDAEASFGSLWDVSNLGVRQRLASFYGERVLVFDYHSMSQSLIESTMALAERLPANATLHLLTLSAGGLIGELLSRGERTDGRMPFDDDDFALVANGRETDRPALRALGDVLERKQLRLERFVRVACPARGSTFYQDAPEKAIELMSSLGSILSAPVALLARQFAKPMRALFADDRLSPAIADLYPTSALMRLLNRPDVHSRSDLAIVTGIHEAGGVWSTLRMLPVKAVHGEDNDLLVLASSTTGGVQRTNGARVLVDRGSQVTHFNYFRNASTLHPIVDALLSGSDAVPAFKPMSLESDPKFSA